MKKQTNLKMVRLDEITESWACLDWPRSMLWVPCTYSNPWISRTLLVIHFLCFSTSKGPLNLNTCLITTTSMRVVLDSFKILHDACLTCRRTDTHLWPDRRTRKTLLEWPRRYVVSFLSWMPSWDFKLAFNCCPHHELLVMHVGVSPFGQGWAEGLLHNTVVGSKDRTLAIQWDPQGMTKQSVLSSHSTL